MKITIEYCVQWNYKPEALRARDRLMKNSNNSVELIEGAGGAFEIVKNGALVFSKKAVNRFPSEEELDGLRD